MQVVEEKEDIEAFECGDGACGLAWGSHSDGGDGVWMGLACPSVRGGVGGDSDSGVDGVADSGVVGRSGGATSAMFGSGVRWVIWWLLCERCALFGRCRRAVALTARYDGRRIEVRGMLSVDMGTTDV